jgi:hypothetical protein
MPKKILWRALEIASGPWMERYIPPLAANGWFRSRREARVVDLAGEPLPWITYPAIAFLERRVRPDVSVFEYGCGASTLWWARRVARVVSVEHDAEWARKVAGEAPAHVEITHAPLGDGYRAAPAARAPFDVVVIDGRDRVACVPHAIAALSSEGVVVFDNSNRPEYASGLRALAGAGFASVPFVGMAPSINEESETTVFYRRTNCLGL